MAEVTVHHLEKSRSTRILWLLEELGVDYEVVSYSRDPKTMLAPPALTRIHPLGKSPVVTMAGETVAESGAIITALCERYDTDGTLVPALGTPASRAYTYWLHYAEGSLLPILLMALVTERIKAARVPFFIRPITKKIAGQLAQGYVEPNLARHLPFIEDTLGASPYFAGETFSAADIQMGYPIAAAASRSGRLSAATSPKTLAWLERVTARPAYRRAAERGGPLAVP